MESAIQRIRSNPAFIITTLLYLTIVAVYLLPPFKTLLDSFFSWYTQIILIVFVVTNTLYRFHRLSHFEEGTIETAHWRLPKGRGTRTSAVGVAVVGTVPAEPVAGAEVVTASDMAKVTLKINGQTHRLLVEPRWSLAHVLREELGLTGTKIGCDRGECGACTVLIDDVPRYACLTLAVEAEGKEITTVEVEECEHDGDEFARARTP